MDNPPDNRAVAALLPRRQFKVALILGQPRVGWLLAGYGVLRQGGGGDGAPPTAGRQCPSPFGPPCCDVGPLPSGSVRRRRVRGRRQWVDVGVVELGLLGADAGMG